MRFSLLSVIAAAIPTVLGWEVTLYDQYDCNDHEGNFNYVSLFRLVPCRAHTLTRYSR
jgi:hypothetical protein